MKIKVLGIGAGGNKAAINLLERGILDETDVKLLNTTFDDIPDEYKNNKSNLAIQFSSELGGCGKEPSEGYKAIVNAVQTKKIDLASFINEDTQCVCLVTSTEGGTGCGATPIIAKYYLAMNLPVHIFALIGFNDDIRGIKNTLKFFKNLDSNITLHTIKNTEFLDYTGNHLKAEEAANEEFANEIDILIGSKMIPSVQNIDPKDMYKLVTTPGYMHISHISLAGVKNQEAFNKAVQEAFDNIKCFDFDKSAKRLGVIINGSEKIQDAVDHNFEVIKRYIGEPYENFRHIQNSEYDKSEWMDIIISGMNFPEKAIVDLNNLYKEVKDKANTSTNSFDDIFSEIDLDDDDEFDMGVRKIKDKNSVDKLFSSIVSEKTDIKNVVIKKDNIDDEY